MMFTRICSDTSVIFREFQKLYFAKLLKLLKIKIVKIAIPFSY